MLHCATYAAYLPHHRYAGVHCYYTATSTASCPRTLYRTHGSGRTGSTRVHPAADSPLLPSAFFHATPATLPRFTTLLPFAAAVQTLPHRTTAHARFPPTHAHAHLCDAYTLPAACVLPVALSCTRRAYNLPAAYRRTPTFCRGWFATTACAPRLQFTPRLHAYHLPGAHPRWFGSGTARYLPTLFTCLHCYHAHARRLPRTATRTTACTRRTRGLDRFHYATHHYTATAPAAHAPLHIAAAVNTAPSRGSAVLSPAFVRLPHRGAPRIPHAHCCWVFAATLPLRALHTKILRLTLPAAVRTARRTAPASPRLCYTTAKARRAACAPADTVLSSFCRVRLHRCQHHCHWRHLSPPLPAF